MNKGIQKGTMIKTHDHISFSFSENEDQDSGLGLDFRVSGVGLRAYRLRFTAFESLGLSDSGASEFSEPLVEMQLSPYNGESNGKENGKLNGNWGNIGI